uniref:Dehydrogenase/reductase (SDR family) X-linked n=1 Tax=Periophthalmus magnuspinnatus TaxID=409849 RepID=A0A3B4B6G7_9GOBI
CHYSNEARVVGSIPCLTQCSESDVVTLSPALPSQSGRVAIVTGATRGMGLETARQLHRLGMHVIIGTNGPFRNNSFGFCGFIKYLRLSLIKVFVFLAEFIFLDLTSLKSIQQFTQNFKQRRLPLHVLVNNAGTMLVPERQTQDGFELHFGLNYLSHFLLTNLLLDVLKDSGKAGRCARIVNMSSATHYAGVIDMNDLNRSYSSHGAYSQSKLALVLFTYCLQEQLTSAGAQVTVNAVDPGMVDTALYDNLWTLAQMLKKPVAKILFRTPAEGASTAVFAAVSSQMEGVGGVYLYNGEKTRSAEISYDSDLQIQLWKRSCQVVGLQ